MNQRPVHICDLLIFQAILTHKGRSSNSGHYVAWVKHKADTWIECNDDDVRPVHVDDVMKLSGGGKTSKNISLFIIHVGKQGKGRFAATQEEVFLHFVLNKRSYM